MNNKLRKQFENIAEIKEMLLNNDELKWCDESERYINSRVFQDAETGYINGALFGWLSSANRDGYKLVPVDTTKDIVKKLESMASSQPAYDGEDIYKVAIGEMDYYWKTGVKPMIGAIE